MSIPDMSASRPPYEEEDYGSVDEDGQRKYPDITGNDGFDLICLWASAAETVYQLVLRDIENDDYHPENDVLNALFALGGHYAYRLQKKLETHDANWAAENRRREAEHRRLEREEEERIADDRLFKESRPLVLERDGNQCLRCGSVENLCADHIIPRCDGGKSSMDNLQTLCRPCNTSKGKKSGREWTFRREFCLGLS